MTAIQRWVRTTFLDFLMDYNAHISDADKRNETSLSLIQNTSYKKVMINYLLCFTK